MNKTIPVAYLCTAEAAFVFYSCTGVFVGKGWKDGNKIRGGNVGDGDGRNTYTS